MPSYDYKVLPEYIGGFGRLSLSGLTRLLQRAATDHTDELGYTSNWYRDHGVAWMARGHRIELENSVGPDETVRVETEVEDFKRIRSLRAYTVYSEATEKLVARGYTDWIYLDRKSNSLKRIPDSMIESFNPVYENESPNRTDFESPTMPEDVPTKTYRTQFRDLDELAHVNNVVYTEYLQDAILRTYGDTDNASIESIPSSFVLSELSIQYLGQADWGNEITCHLNPDRSDGNRTEFDFTITRQSERIVEARGAWRE